MSEEIFTQIIYSQTEGKMNISDCSLQIERETQEGFSEKQREILLQMFALKNVQTMEETLLEKTKSRRQKDRR